MNISVVIPVYKNKEQFLTNLKHNLTYMKDCEVVIVNDYPEESLHDDLAGLSVILLENDKNLGFGPTVNRGVKHATKKYVMLLNTDVKLHDGSFSHTLELFRNDPNLFAVSFAQIEKSGQIVGKNQIYWENGLFKHRKANDLTEGINGWAEGGSSIFDRDKYLQLGGFDPLYSPFYWEDVDLSYRAWKRGWKVLFDPGVLVEHHHESTISTYFKQQLIKTISYRNQLIFIWKNITDSDLLTDHFLNLPLLKLSMLKKREWIFFRALIEATKCIGIIRKRRADAVIKKSDKEILNQFK